MAKIKIEEIIEHLDSELKRALEDTLKECFPNQDFDARVVFKTFIKQVSRKCGSWENVPDRFVKKEGE